MLNYSRVFSSAALDLGFTDHESDLNEISAIQEALNDVAFRTGDPFTPFVDEQLGGNGDNDTELRSTQNTRGSLEYFVGSSWGAARTSTQTSVARDRSTNRCANLRRSITSPLNKMTSPLPSLVHVPPVNHPWHEVLRNMGFEPSK